MSSSTTTAVGHARTDSACAAAYAGANRHVAMIAARRTGRENKLTWLHSLQLMIASCRFDFRFAA